MKQIGIYKITSPSKRVYIGQSVNIEKRFNTYEKLRCKKQIRLYNSFLKYGVENHVFEIIEFCEEKELNKRERFFQEKFEVIEKGLNCQLTKTKDKSGRLSEEMKRKISEATKGKNNFFFGKKHSEETKKKIGQASKGRKYSEETRQKKSEAFKGQKNPFFGIKHSEETKKKMSEGRKEKKHSEETKKKIGQASKGINNHKTIIVLNTETGIYYFGSREAGESLNIKEGTLRGKLNGRDKNNTSFIRV